MRRITSNPPPGGHRRGKLVVIAIIGMGLVLGLIALAFRKTMPARPTTRPASTQPVLPASLNPPG